ncbi:MAG: type II secretion system protein [Planctomycetota bacterium]
MPANEDPAALRRHAFTLVEIVIVVLILGVLAGIAAPRLVDVTQRAAEGAFARELMAAVEAIERYRAIEGGWPPDSNTGTISRELSGYIDPRSFQGFTPIGGYWDVETHQHGVECGVGAAFQQGQSPPPNEVLLRIDGLIDDGQLDSGSLRFITRDRYYFVID